MASQLLASITQAVINTGTLISVPTLQAFIAVESGGLGFSKDTGKIIIQFEPHYFKKREPYAPSGAWSVNKVDVQSKEWIAFNNAFSIDADSAMESTSIGLPQIMGAHWKRLGYSNVGEMWDHFKSGEVAQIEGLIQFILTDATLYKAVLNKSWTKVAELYNGAGFRELAKKYGREPYDLSMAKAYTKFSSTPT